MSLKLGDKVFVADRNCKGIIVEDVKGWYSIKLIDFDYSKVNFDFHTNFLEKSLKLISSSE